jgi:TPR repeat protein
MIQARVPLDVDYALLSTTWYPHEAESWFWAADIYSGSLRGKSIQVPAEIIDHELAVQYYQSGLEVDPENGHRLVRLGHALRRSRRDVEGAIQVYKQACYYNFLLGCYYAGRYSEAIGDMPAAIYYYSLYGIDANIDAAPDED